MDNLTPQAVARLVGAGTNLIHVVTENERRTELLVVQTAARLKGAGTPLIWTCTDGFSRDGAILERETDPVQAVDYVRNLPGSGVFLFKDLHWFWQDNPVLIRKLKDFAATARSKVIIISAPVDNVPESLRDDIAIVSQGLPPVEEIEDFLGQLQSRDARFATACAAEPALLEKLAVAGRGLDLADIERAVKIAAMAPSAGGGGTMVRTLFERKKFVVRKSGIMEFVDNDAGPDQLGGMDNLKTWLDRREAAFGLKNLTAGRNFPKGVLIMGIAGCGKSLFVKAIAGRWNLPLIRLDMASVYGGGHGQPEASMVKAFATAEAVAPCVLWIDEIEAGISSQGFKAEGGVSSRILGSFLTWMQEKKAPVFVAATANAIEMLPAEVLRKGRFDEIFYVGLPDPAGREEIFRIHLARQQVDPGSFDLSLLAGSTRGFSGAEIEQAIMTGTFEALSGHRALTQQDLLAAISRTVPMSVTMAEQIKKIEAWAFKRAVPASGKFSPTG